jgi:hypothetical protein
MKEGQRAMKYRTMLSPIPHSSPDVMVSDPSTKIARQGHSADGRERIFFPLSFAFFTLALRAAVPFADQMRGLAFLFALRAAGAPRWLAPVQHY